MTVIDYWTTDTELVAMDDKAVLNFIPLDKLKAYLERNNFLDWHWNVKDDLDTAIQKGKVSFDEWLNEPEWCKRDLACYLESQRMIRSILDPINNILKTFKR